MINPSFESNEEFHKDVKNSDPAPRQETSVAIPTKLCSNGISKEPHESSKSKYVVSRGYDPYLFGNMTHATSVFGVVTHIIVISFGPTLLGIPASFVQVGYLMGFVCALVTVILYAYCMRMIITTEYELCSRAKKPNMSYTELVREAFDCGPVSLRWCARYTEIIIYIVFLCIWLGGNSILFLIASENLKNAWDFFFSTDIDMRIVMICLIVPLVLLCWIPDLKLLVPVSVLTNIINAFSICVILYYSLLDFPKLSDRKMMGNVGSIPVFVGLVLFTINATGIMLPLKNEMKYPKKFKTKFGVITISYVAVSLMYSVFGFICYIKYGENSKNIIIQNLPETKFNKIVIGLYGIGNCFFYPIMAYVSFDIIWNHMLKDKFEKNEHKVFYEYVCRTMIAISSMIFAYVIPNIGLFLSLTGTVGTSIDSLVIPALTEMLIYIKCKKYFLYFKNICIIFVAVLLIISGFVDCIGQLLNSF